MARTTEELVRGVLLKDYDDATNPSLEPFIEAAAVLVAAVVACAARKEVTLSSANLEILERWLAAHSYCMSDPQYSEKQTGRSKGVFLGDKAVKGLEGSRYGQHAMTLDPSGCLRGLNKSKPKLAWLGLYPSEQTQVIDKE